MDVIGHHDVGVEEVVFAVVGERFEEEVGVAFDLEDTSSVLSCRGDEVSAWDRAAFHFEKCN